MGFFSDLISPGRPEVLDTRDPSYVSHFRRLLESPGYGFSDAFRSPLQDPAYKRAGERYGEGVSGAYSSRGFGSLRTGPAAFQHAQGLREMEEGRASKEADLGLEWARTVLGWPGGYSGQTGYWPQPSPFANLMDPFVKTAMKEYGGRVGRGETNPFSSLWNALTGGGGGNYTPGNLFGSAGTMFT